MRLTLLGLLIGVGCAPAPTASPPQPESLALAALASRLSSALYQPTVWATAWAEAGTLGLSVADSALLAGGTTGHAHARAIARWAWAHYDGHPPVDGVVVFFARADLAPAQFGRSESGFIYRFSAKALGQ